MHINSIIILKHDWCQILHGNSVTCYIFHKIWYDYLLFMITLSLMKKKMSQIVDFILQKATFPKYRGSYMSAHVLLNLWNELGKRDKMRGLPSILSLLRNEFNKFNNTWARMLDYIYHMTNTLKSHFWRYNFIILSLCTQRCYGHHNVSRKSINH